MARFNLYTQQDAKDCGPACLRMVAKYYGKNIYSMQKVRENSYITREGISILGLIEAAEKIGFKAMAVKIDFDKLKKEAPLPLIIHWEQNHFVVVYKLTKSKVYVADPAFGKVKYSKDEFNKSWATTRENNIPYGICLLLEPTSDFYIIKDEKPDHSKFKFLIKYIAPHRRFVLQLLLGLLAGSILQLIFPFLTQAIVDIGINTQDLNFIYIILIAQLVLFMSRLSVDFIRSWILLHISSRINISLLSDFIIKLMKLPLHYFDSKMTGDFLQRIKDHSRIEYFLTTQTLVFLFSIISIVVFSIVLAIYNMKIFLVFLMGSSFYIIWLLSFMKKRKEIDYKKFIHKAKEQNGIIQLINGMHEIRLNLCERKKRWDWEHIQAQLFSLKIKSLRLNQYQNLGGLFFNETKNIIITVIAATAVINGHISLGVMLAIQYIIGQLNSPIDQLIDFFHSAQDAKLSFERLAGLYELVKQTAYNILCNKT